MKVLLNYTEKNSQVQAMIEPEEACVELTFPSQPDKELPCLTVFVDSDGITVETVAGEHLWAMEYDQMTY